MTHRSTARPFLLLLALVAAVLALAACGGSDDAAAPETTAPAETEAPPAETEAPPAETEEPPAETEEPPAETEAPLEPATIKVALDWFPNPDHVALYYALENGFFDEQALTVEFEVPSDVTAGLKLVATNQFDLSVFYQGDMFFAAQEELPVIAVGSLVPTPLNVLMSLSDSKVQGPDTIKGATIGVAGLPFDDAILTTMRQQQGLAKGDVKSVNVGFDLVPALLTKKVDAVIGAYFNIEGIHIESQTGSPPTIVKLEDLGVPHYDELLVVANSERLQSDAAYADAVKRFLAAMVAATEAAQADEAGSIEIMKANTEYTAEEIEGMVPDTLPLLTSPKGVPTGCFDLEGWATFGQWMLDNGLLDGAIDPATIATNEYLPGC
ncbi:MAG: ABC transporter substrate-binding protein [Thermoleophilia bacterium]|nr:ABC transporter substrate-binding protein [Thermoleophilia bacterium]